MGACCFRSGYDNLDGQIVLPPQDEDYERKRAFNQPRLENVVGERQVPQKYGGYHFEERYANWSDEEGSTASATNFSREGTTDPGWSDDEDDRAAFLAKTILEDKRRTTPALAGTPTPNTVLFRKLEEVEGKKVPRRVVSIPKHIKSGEKGEKESDQGGDYMGGDTIISPKEEGSILRYKSHSTATNFVSSTISTPDLNQVLWCMASAMYYHVTVGQQAETKVTFDIFDERLHPLYMKGDHVQHQLQEAVMPRVKTMYKFINTIFVVERLPSECAILALAYVERLIQSAGVTVDATNWKRVLLGALVLASKVWEEQAVWNVDFLNVFPTMNVHDLNKLESFFLELISYNVSLKGSEYAKYYFELRELAEKEEKQFPLDPLNKKRTSLLEKRTTEREKQVKQGARTVSMDDIQFTRNT